MTKLVVWNPFTVPLKEYAVFFTEAATLKNRLEMSMVIVVNDTFMTSPSAVEKSFSRYSKTFVNDDLQSVLEPDDIVFTPSQYANEFPDNKVVTFDNKSLEESENKASKAVLLGQFDIFLTQLPVGLNKSEHKKLYKTVRSHVMKPTIDVTETREKFFQGALCQEGDMVVYNKTGEVAMVDKLGSNFVTINLDNDNKVRCWLEDITPLER